jgi:hypothetical protein
MPAVAGLEKVVVFDKKRGPSCPRSNLETFVAVLWLIIKDEEKCEKQYCNLALLVWLLCMMEAGSYKKYLYSCVGPWLQYHVCNLMGNRKWGGKARKMAKKIKNKVAWFDTLHFLGVLFGWDKYSRMCSETTRFKFVFFFFLKWSICKHDKLKCQWLKVNAISK